MEKSDNYKKFIRNDIVTFSKDINVLRYLVRYQNVQRIHDETVAEHIGITALFCLKLREYYNFNLETALKTALVHDCSEARLSDIPHNIKHANPELFETFAEVEDKINKTILSDEAASLINDFNKGLTPEGLAVQLSDVLSVVLHARSELMAGNQVFNYIAIKAIARCRDIVDAFDTYRNEQYTKEQIMNKINQLVNIY
jgi:5'-deoxynucleotidase YfbR-like HD superfamily hydrolase